ncbi:MAG: exosortase N [Spirochaetae bacterium HGW-Spirochaetae-10]|nr:MAG: exosortase N [Spirochaetae bacterium HGW-Spirochaetae-10]
MEAFLVSLKAKQNEAMRLVVAVLTAFVVIGLVIAMWRSAEVILGQASVGVFFPLLFLPFFLYTKEADRTDLLYGFAGIALLVIGTVESRHSFVWLGAASALFGLLSSMGIAFRFPAQALFLAVPPFNGLGGLLYGYELRLHLTALVEKMLRSIDSGTVTKGNLIFFKDNWFLVDQACEGMAMGVATMVIVSIFFQRVTLQGRLSIALLAPLLWLFANLWRIALLVITGIPPGRLAHDGIGLVVFACMIVFPLAMLALLFERPMPRSEAASLQAPGRALLILLMPVSLFASLIGAAEVRNDNDLAARLAGGSDTAVIHRFGSGTQQTIVLEKHNLSFFGVGHHPRVCFEGAGFAFLSEHEEHLPGGETVRMAELRPPGGGDAVFVYWWFQSQEGLSSDDISWRVRELRGSPVTQWNVYGNDRSQVWKHVLQTAYRK